MKRVSESYLNQKESKVSRGTNVLKNKNSGAQAHEN